MILTSANFLNERDRLSHKGSRWSLVTLDVPPSCLTASLESSLMSKRVILVSAGQFS